jgi:predicted ATP-dependent protease
MADQTPRMHQNLEARPAVTKRVARKAAAKAAQAERNATIEGVVRETARLHGRETPNDSDNVVAEDVLELTYDAARANRLVRLIFNHTKAAMDIARERGSNEVTAEDVLLAGTRIRNQDNQPLG